MALVFKDRVNVTTTTAGTGTVTLGSAVSGYQDFSVIGNGNTTYYAIVDPTGDWEVGIGTYSSTGPTLSRDTVLESSNAGSLVPFGAGTKNVFVTYAAEKSVILDASGNVTPLGTVSSGTWQGTAIAEAYGGTGLTSLGSGVATWLGTPSSVNLAAAVTDETGSGALVFGTTPTLTGPRFVVSALGTLTTGTTTINLATANSYSATITASNTITIAFSNAPSAGNSQVVLLRLIDAGGGTIVWPTNTKFAAGTAPTLTASGVDVLGVYYDVTTTTYMVFVIGLDVKVP